MNTAMNLLTYWAGRHFSCNYKN